MKYIKLFENYFEDEEFIRLAPYFLMSSEKLVKIIFDEVKKDKSDVQLIEDLLDTQLVNIEVTNELGASLLHYAAMYDNIEVATLLLDRDFNVDESWWGSTSLHYAARDNSVQVATLLLDRGAKIEARDEDQRTPLHWAAKYDSLAVAKLLLDRGAEIDARNEYQWTPLHDAARWDSIAVTELLLHRGAKIDAMDRNQQTPWDLTSKVMRNALSQLNPNYK